MKLLDYEFWKDLASVWSYFFAASALITNFVAHIYLVAVCVIGIAVLCFCVIQMVLHKYQRKHSPLEKYFGVEK
ncbi:MAG: hypothetical protein O3A66_02050 [Proteobacteria bacterium]|jgi:hypothetical protein|nr:hypothetical protein [Pseudomonadota bacterium]